ncbi:hypothetical protein [Janthinobacterium sp. PC23-8]|uniref:hypothetical protein n=1 Tax=Janthinobacterium sp. PC23-8 TaxID=2012679 RepID=UPI000B960091|nr:hypothetical protein [Janthinobacterium sp. PC23-8]OYO29091.1 hypothetical protein CD932_18450 [Janthinobacterium sp. PC23-8]
MADRLAAMKKMFGYGHPAARCWVVGLEEHCTLADLEKRIAWRVAHPKCFIDLEDFHIDLLDKLPAMQEVPVWTNAHKIYQAVYGCNTLLGRLDIDVSDLLLSEILPLPKPQLESWPKLYHDLFKNNLAYRRAVRSEMSDRLVEMVDKFKPEVVILHGKTQHDWWLGKSPTLAVGWTSEAVVKQPRHSLSWRLRNNTLWVRTNNLVNNGWVRFGPEQIEQLAGLIRRERVSRPVCAGLTRRGSLDSGRF